MYKKLSILFILLFSLLVNAEDIIDNDEPAVQEKIQSEDDSFKHSKNYATVQVLNKITAKSEYLNIKVGSDETWGYIKIKVNECWQSAPYELTENKILLDVYEKKPGTGDFQQVFFGWMFSSSPAISSMENPIYDIVAVNCFDKS